MITYCSCHIGLSNVTWSLDWGLLHSMLEQSKEMGGHGLYPHLGGREEACCHLSSSQIWPRQYHLTHWRVHSPHSTRPLLSPHTSDWQDGQKRKSFSNIWLSWPLFFIPNIVWSLRTIESFCAYSELSLMIIFHTKTPEYNSAFTTESLIESRSFSFFTNCRINIKSFRLIETV